MKTVPVDAVVNGEGRFEELPEQVRDGLGELAGAAREGLLALSVGVGLGVLSELMETEVDEAVGPKGASMIPAGSRSATVTTTARSRLAGGAAGHPPTCPHGRR